MLARGGGAQLVRDEGERSVRGGDFERALMGRVPERLGFTRGQRGPASSVSREASSMRWASQDSSRPAAGRGSTVRMVELRSAGT